MKSIVILMSLLLLVPSCGRIDAPVQRKTEAEIKAEDQYNKELEQIRESIRGDIRIKVKKDAKGYSWEITGKDAQEVLKANNVLRKRLEN